MARKKKKKTHGVARWQQHKSVRHKKGKLDKKEDSPLMLNSLLQELSSLALASNTATNNISFAASVLGYYTLRPNFKLIIKDQEFCTRSDDDKHYVRFNH